MATRVIVETIKEYFLANPDSVIREVYLCDIKTLVVEAFTAALKEKFLNVVEGEGHDQAWKRLKTPHGNLSMDNFIHNKYPGFFYTHHKRNFKGVVFELSCPCSYLVQGLAMHFFKK